MPRPLIQHGVGQLEELFFKSKSDQKVLKQLENELKHRHVPRAVALLAEVQAAMFVGKEVEAPTPAIARPPQTPPSQPDLRSQSKTPPTPTVPPFVPAPARTVASTLAVATPAGPAPLSPRATPALTVEDAYKLLKASPGSTWESIEHTRRLLVQQSSPLRTSKMSADERAQALAQARRVNEAYAVLSTQRAAAGNGEQSTPFPQGRNG